jgi:hypothetical protein
MKVASYEDAWLRENDQTHHPGWVPTFFYTVRIDLHLQLQLQVKLFLNIRMVGIAHAQTRLRFRAQNDRKSQDFFLRNNFPVVSWGFYVHFRKETRIFIKM